MAIALLFSGQGAQSVGMGRDMVERSSAAAGLYERADAVLPFSLSQASFEGPADLLTETRVCQPALFVHGLAIVELLKSAGKLAAVDCASGLSLGELTALCVAGVYDYETGLRVVAERGRLMQECCERTDGTMASLIGGTPEAAQELASEFDVDIGNHNCPGQIVLSGATSGVNAAVGKAKSAGFKMAVPLQVTGAYHSRLMQPAAEAFEAFLATVEFSRPRLPVFSNVTGEAADDPETIKSLLVRQVTSPVRWETCFRNVVGRGVERSLECGPGGVLAGLAKRIDRGATVISIDSANGVDALDS